MGLIRGATEELITDLRGPFHPVLLTHAMWGDEEIWIHTGVGDLVWSEKTWTGLAQLVQFTAPREEGGLASAEASVRVAATLEDVLAERSRSIRNKSVVVWFATTTEAAGSVLKTTPVPLFTGYFDSRVSSVVRSGDDLSHDMVIGLGMGPSARSSASIAHSYEDQITKYPGDTAGRHVQNQLKLQANPKTWPE